MKLGQRNNYPRNRDFLRKKQKTKVKIEKIALCQLEDKSLKKSAKEE